MSSRQTGCIFLCLELDQLLRKICLCEQRATIGKRLTWVYTCVMCQRACRFAFSGPLPEKANGRLAMLGFVAALGAELSTGQPVVTQVG